MKVQILILVLISFLMPLRFFAQISSTNFIIVIDGRIVTSTFANMHLVFKQKDGSIREVQADYIPGRLSYDSITKEQVSEMGNTGLLTFDFYKTCNKKQIIYNYKIEVFKSYLFNAYNVIHIYDLDNKKNRRMYFPLEEQNYTYEVDNPDGGFRRILRKAPKKGCY